MICEKDNAYSIENLAYSNQRLYAHSDQTAGTYSGGKYNDQVNF